MRYWWVNQNQTFRQEVDNGYMWSPKRSKGDRRNPFYETMREVAPGDTVFSFVNTRIGTLGKARSYAEEAPKPEEFGLAGAAWSNIGWKVHVEFTELEVNVRPKDHMDILGPLLPEKYSPLQANGDGKQVVYLAEVPVALAEALLTLLGPEARALADSSVAPATTDSVAEWEDRIEDAVRASADIPETERVALVKSRRGQGLFRDRVAQMEKGCRITKVTNPAHLRASHCKPWRDCSNEERLDGENGLFLTPTIDHLFDRGFISFKDDGSLIVSPVADRDTLKLLGIELDANVNVGSFTEGQKRFLAFHRAYVLLQSEKG